MQDPVIDPEGNSYERIAIVNWLRTNPTSPITRSPLNISQLVPNRALRNAIENELLINIAPNEQSDEKESEKDHKEEKKNDVPDVVSLSMISNIETKELMISIIPPDKTSRGPLDIVCVVDVSGSMGETASIQGVESSALTLTLLDIVRHALKTIIVTLSENDRIALVTYSNEARIIFSLTFLNQAGRARANSLVDSLVPGGMTNLWDGLAKGLDILATDQLRVRSAQSGELLRNSAIFLLTDGIPNIEPPRGHLPRLRRYRDSQGGIYPAIISTFGFGYSLRSSLLRELAVEGSGMYAFIPDSGFVGTAFVNALSNQMVSFGHRATLHIACSHGVRVADDEDPGLTFCQEITDTTATLDIGTLQYGQPRHVVVRVVVPEGLSHDEFLQSCQCTLNYTPYLGTSNDFEVNICCDHLGTGQGFLLELEIQSFRFRLIHYISNGITSGVVTSSPAESILANDMRQWLRNHPKSRRGNSSVDKLHDIVNGMLSDLTGQITEALTRRDYFDKWGCHYLPSLQRAHELQQCTNFKDPGVKNYGGQLFHQVSELADEMFCALPPPAPSTTAVRPSPTLSTPRAQASCSSSVTYTAPPIPSMSLYHCAAAGCFHGSCLVTMSDGTLKNASSIQQGDYVLCPSSTRYQNQSPGLRIIAKVESILRTFSLCGVMNLVSYEGGLLVTPWHPIQVKGKWSFPAEDQDGILLPHKTDAIYSFLLGPEILVDVDQQNHESNDIQSPSIISRGQSLLINGMICISLGHGIQNDPVASHSFFGTEKIVDEMKIRASSTHLPTYVDLKEGEIRKDPITQLACGFMNSEQE